MKEISPILKKNIKKLLEEHNTHREISIKLNCSLSTISKYRKMFDITAKSRPSGRKPKLNPVMKRNIVRSVITGTFDNAVQIKKNIAATHGIDVSPETVRRVLRQAGMKGRAKIRKPLLTDRHRKLRLQFAKKYKNYTISDWENVVWSDETKINRLGSDGREWVWKKPLSKCLVKETVKFGGGNIMISGCMHSSGVGVCTKVEGRMTAQSYVQILNDSLVSSLRKWGKGLSDIVIQQDNDPKHTARLTRDWFRNKGINVLDWPPQSPDLNPIEHLWGILKRRVSSWDHSARSMDEVWHRVETEWQNISTEECQKLIHSMPSRIKAVLAAKGGHTKY